MEAAHVPVHLRSPRRIFVHLPRWIGDTVMSTPAIRALATAYPDAELVVAGGGPMRDIVEGLPFIDRYVEAPARTWRDAWAFSRVLRGERFDWAILLGESERTAAAPLFARIPLRAGYGRGWLKRRMMTHHLERPRRPDGTMEAYSMIQRYLEVTRSLGVPDDGDHMAVPVHDDARAVVRERLDAFDIGERDPIATIIAGASFGAAKMWPPAHFAAAADTLRERHGLRTVLAPGPGEESIGAAVASSAKYPIGVLAGPTLKLRETAALLDRSDVVLANDTGPRSMAVALDVPTVVPIGPTEHGHTNHHLERQRILIEEDVECRPCRLRTCPIDHRCMTRITPERVADAASELLSEFGSRVA